MARFEATRGLFCDRPRNFEARSNDGDDAWAGTATTCDLVCGWPLKRRIFGGIGFRTCHQDREYITRLLRPRSSFIASFLRCHDSIGTHCNDKVLRSYDAKLRG
ncbi:hypothetical protein AVEN_143114-1 [Araneus ventricosus]|uniref:Uncharacterized protein n=1 Tax=Araneus ventricosus TaxID=182803 RepID=A0A4Y2KJ69_ARAVE|nr:hypothetical protein AVEN_143114-1 [Araneus ventricosus]